MTRYHHRMKKQKTQLRPLTLSRLATLTKAELKQAAAGNFVNAAIEPSNFVNAQ